MSLLHSYCHYKRNKYTLTVLLGWLRSMLVVVALSRGVLWPTLVLNELNGRRCGFGDK